MKEIKNYPLFDTLLSTKGVVIIAIAFAAVVIAVVVLFIITRTRR